MKENLENYLKRLESAGLLRKERIGIDQIRALLMSASKNIVASGTGNWAGTLPVFSTIPSARKSASPPRRIDFER